MTIEGREKTGLGRRLRLGMVGGGRGGFIGAVHRMASRLDDRYDLVAGAFSSDPERTRASAADLFVPPDRAYDDFRAMAEAEAARPDGIEVVAVVTPNHLHHAAARAFLDAGVHVICDKPMTTSLDDARDLMAAVRRTGLVFGLTHNYSGYPMVRQMRAMVEAGELGPLRSVQMRYAQDWLTTAIERDGQKQATWRTDPAKSGAAGCLGDIGTHAYHLAAFVTGLETAELSADLSTFVDGRALDDDARVLLRYENGARGMLWASQVAPGNANDLTLEVYGATAGLVWRQEEPNTLRFARHGRPLLTLIRGGPEVGEAASHATRVPGGHPEGYVEAFAQIYADLAERVAAHVEGRAPAASCLLTPTVEDGARGVAFIAAAVDSSRRNGAWTRPEPIA